MDKITLRKKYLEKRKTLSEDEVRLKSLTLLQALKQTDIFKHQVFHVFLPIKSKHEIFTWFLIEFLRMKNKTVVTSVCNFKTITLEHYILDENTVLEENQYGVPEPINAKPIDEAQFDVVFVPLLISDTHNHRVGYGKGFYDRFLAMCREDVQTIGLSFFKPIAKIEGLNMYDIPLRKVLYQNHIC